MFGRPRLHRSRIAALPELAHSPSRTVRPLCSDRIVAAHELTHAFDVGTHRITQQESRAGFHRRPQIGALAFSPELLTGAASERVHVFPAMSANHKRDHGVEKGPIGEGGAGCGWWDEIVEDRVLMIEQGPTRFRQTMFALARWEGRCVRGERIESRACRCWHTLGRTLSLEKRVGIDTNARKSRPASCRFVIHVETSFHRDSA